MDWLVRWTYNQLVVGSTPCLLAIAIPGWVTVYGQINHLGI